MEENSFYSSLNFSLTGRIPKDVRLSDLGFEEQFSLANEVGEGSHVQGE